MSLALASAQAAPVYSINGAPAVPIDPSGIINIGTLGTAVTLHVFDSVTLGSGLPPQDSVGQLVIRANLLQGGSLTLGVVDGDDFPTVQNEPDQLYERGLVSLGGLRLETLAGDENPALRDATTLIAFIGNPSAADPGSITGTISVGRVYALDVPGDLSGIVTATAIDPNLDQGQMAIQRVRVGGNLSGTVQATGGTPPLDAIGRVLPLRETASINTLIVGPASTSKLTGQVLAENGWIRRVLSAGEVGQFDDLPIGGQIQRFAGTPAQIRAGLGLFEFRTALENSPLPTTARTDVNANIVSAKAIGDGRFEPKALPQFRFANASAAPEPWWVAGEFDAPMRLIEINGDLWGDLTIANLGWTDDQQLRPFGTVPAAFSSASDPRSGVFIDGVARAKITIQYCLSRSNIVARSFTEPVRIGVVCRGAVVATGGKRTGSGPGGWTDETTYCTVPNDGGTMAEVSIGYGVDGQTTTLDAISLRYADANGRGLLGSMSIPFHGPRFLDWVQPRSNYSAVGGSAGRNLFADGPAHDSAVRARGRIETVRVHTMSRMINRTALIGEPERLSAYTARWAPRIEAPSVGFLQIGALRSGQVWSGQTQGWEDVQISLFDGTTFTEPRERITPAAGQAGAGSSILGFASGCTSNTSNLSPGDIELWHMNVGQAVVGAVWKGSGMWVGGFSSLDVLESMNGYISTPKVGLKQYIRIGRRFGYDCVGEPFATGHPGLEGQNELVNPGLDPLTGEPNVPDVFDEVCFIEKFVEKFMPSYFPRIARLPRYEIYIADESWSNPDPSLPTHLSRIDVLDAAGLEGNIVVNARADRTVPSIASVVPHFVSNLLGSVGQSVVPAASGYWFGSLRVRALDSSLPEATAACIQRDDLGGIVDRRIIYVRDPATTNNGTLATGNETFGLRLGQRYTELSECVGGGVIGVVPFNVYAGDSSPNRPNSEEVGNAFGRSAALLAPENVRTAREIIDTGPPGQPNAANPIEIAFTGTVVFGASGPSSHFRVLHKRDETSEETDVTEAFTFQEVQDSAITRPATKVRLFLNPVRSVLVPPFGSYRVTAVVPVEGQPDPRATVAQTMFTLARPPLDPLNPLLFIDVPVRHPVFEQVPSDTTEDFRFVVQRVQPCSPADISDTDSYLSPGEFAADCDGGPATAIGPDSVVDNGDYAVFFGAFFLPETNPCRLVADIADTDGNTRLDGGPLNGDGVVDNGDFNAFFAYFFYASNGSTPCPTASIYNNGGAHIANPYFRTRTRYSALSASSPWPVFGVDAHRATERALSRFELLFGPNGSIFHAEPPAQHDDDPELEASMMYATDGVFIDVHALPREALRQRMAFLTMINEPLTPDHFFMIIPEVFVPAPGFTPAGQ